MCLTAHVYTFMKEGASSQCQLSSLITLSLIFLRQDLLLTGPYSFLLDLTDLARMTSQQALGNPLVSASTVQDYSHMLPCPYFSVGSGNLKPDPDAYSASTSPREPSPQPCMFTDFQMC